MKKIIVATTIYPVSEAMKKFATFKDWELIIVGDKKTPHEEYIKLSNENKNVFYMTPEYQEENWKEISDLIGWNKIQRRNIGYLEALKRGGEIIASVDDDNIPLDNWDKNIRIGKPTNVYYYKTNDIAFDPVGVTNYKDLWHRGYPIQLLNGRNERYTITRKTIVPDIQAMFWNGDPDIDAVCRLEHKPMCFFDDKYFPIATNVYSPFNSQNTLFSREALKKYLVMPGIGRMDDIWSSYYLEACGFKVVYTKATVFQDRNVQDLTKNLKEEFIGYEKTLDLLNHFNYKQRDDMPFGIPKNTYSPEDAYKKFLPDSTIKVMESYLNIAKNI
tara:strand:- start:9963 stop:10952 length:990 start_codon:yes stop_codon:yes gene_type:complete